LLGGFQALGVVYIDELPVAKVGFAFASGMAVRLKHFGTSVAKDASGRGVGVVLRLKEGFYGAGQ
jgi:uncharacterized spore protein YtfJ